METLFKELGDQSLLKDFCQTVASSFRYFYFEIMQLLFYYVIRFYLYICCLNCLCLFHDLILVGIKSCSVNRKGKSSITWKQVRFFIISFLQRNVAQGEVTFVSFEMMFFFSGTGLVSGEFREAEPTKIQDCAIFPFADC